MISVSKILIYGKEPGMQNFYLEGKGVLPIGMYKKEYADKIKCEDKNCRIKIKYIPSTPNKRAYFKEFSPEKHKVGCSVKSKNKKQDSSSEDDVKKPEYIQKELIPVLMLKKDDKDEGGKGGGNRTVASNSGANIIRNGTKIGNKRKYFYSLSTLAKYIRDNYGRLEELEIVDGKTSKKLFEVVRKSEDLTYESYDKLRNEMIVVLGVVKDITNHLVGHKSLWFGDKSDMQTPRIFINSSLLGDKNKIDKNLNKEVLVYGKYERISEKYSAQITIESLTDLQIISG